jgi:Mg-chelatase subunit ChlD
MRRKVRVRGRKSLVIFAVDASESMAVHARMAVAKGAVLALLRAAYLRRDRVAVVAFEGDGARVLLEPTPSIDRARERLRRLPVGGATPLAAGLMQAWDLLRAERLREPQLAPTLVLISDGAANVPLEARANPRREVLCLAARIRADKVAAVVVDAGSVGPTRPELLEIAERLGAPLVRVGLAGASAIVSAVRGP